MAVFQKILVFDFMQELNTPPRAAPGRARKVCFKKVAR